MLDSESVSCSFLFSFKIECVFFQSNHEGELIEKIHSVDNRFSGIIINPAAYTHTSIALLDALRASNKPKIEIHISNIYAREDYRRKSITSEAVNGVICGFGENGYVLAIDAIINLIKSKASKSTRRQDAPKVYAFNGSLYLYNIKSLKTKPVSEFNKIKKLIKSIVENCWYLRRSTELFK